MRLLPALLALWAPLADAHSFGQVYSLPVPFWLYAWAGAAALILSFVIFGLFLTRPGLSASATDRDLPKPVAVRIPGLLLLPLQGFSVAMLALCIATGWWGTPSPYGNFSMTFFWIVFALGFAWFCMLCGNWYAVLSPWQVLAGWIGYFWTRYRTGLIRYPTWLAYWPALLLYMGFIWVELLAANTPLLLAQLLAGYTLLNLLGAGLFGIASWFRYCEFFAVLFRVLSALAPVQIMPGEGSGPRLSLQGPLRAGTGFSVDRVSLLLFVLFLLSSTAFDGLHEALVWYRFYWVDLFHCCLQHLFGSHPFRAYPKMLESYRYWQSGWLLISPLLYLLAYLLFLVFSRWFAGARRSIPELALVFAPSLIPIAAVYHVSHYFTLLQTQGVQIVRLASDPLGRGWNLFGTADWLQRNLVPDASLVWHAQVGLIVGGHVLGVWMAHLIALREFSSPRRAMFSQLPMLVLMVLFTVAGLWILSLPNMAPVER